MKALSSPRRTQPIRPRQGGLVLIIVILVLLSMSLAGVAMMRGVLTSNKVAGNLAFKQSAVHAAESGFTAAIQWLQQNNAGAGLHQTIAKSSTAPVGYFAVRQDPDTATGQTWDAFWRDSLATSGSVNTLAADTNGNQVSYVIHRLCSSAGNPAAGIGCELPPSTATSSGNSMGANSQMPDGVSSQVYYRITARVAGPRNTVGFVQTVVAM